MEKKRAEMWKELILGERFKTGWFSYYYDFSPKRTVLSKLHDETKTLMGNL